MSGLLPNPRSVVQIRLDEIHYCLPRDVKNKLKLSGGEKQRIGLARALFSNPELLVLDEATSALDVDTENAVMQSILNLDRPLTVIAIAHRISSIASFDYIYLLDGGRVEGQGSFQELYQSNINFKNQVDFLRLN